MTDHRVNNMNNQGTAVTIQSADRMGEALKIAERVEAGDLSPEAAKLALAAGGGPGLADMVDALKLRKPPTPSRDMDAFKINQAQRKAIVDATKEEGDVANAHLPARVRLDIEEGRARVINDDAVGTTIRYV